MFQTYSNEIITKVVKDYVPKKQVDALTFLTSSEYQNEDLIPVQRVIIKTFYNLWEIYPPDKEEQKILDILKNEWRINIDLHRKTPIKFLVLVLGRRSTKSTTISFIATYEAYSLICKGNPQEYYGIRDRHTITIMHVAAAGSQAEDVFALTKNNIRKNSFFEPYIDFDKDSTTELRLFTPYDLRLNDEIKYKNSLIKRGSGIQRASLLPGSIMIESVTTSAATHRGKSIKTLMLSEFAHFERPKLRNVEDSILFENPKTDYAIWKAFVPSTKDFKEDGKVLIESSPRDKGGEFYNQYCIAGGMEQENFESVIPDPSYALIQLSTWQARFETFTFSDFVDDFRKDPIGAQMEYGAHFGNPAGSSIQEQWIENAIQKSITIVRSNPKRLKYVISVDPGGKSKQKTSDTYAIAWGHVEGVLNEDVTEEKNLIYYIDGLKGFDSTTRYEGGQYIRHSVDPNDVINFILNLVDDLGGKNFIHEIVYDQFDSTSPVAILQSLGLPAIETTFTAGYKADMYGDFLEKLALGQVRIYGIDEEGWVERWKLELKYLQRVIQGNKTFYHHPSTGPVQHDDFADVTANLVHRLCLISTPTHESIRQLRHYGVRPFQLKKLPKPLMAKRIH
uniref:Terminase n=1 Tax=Dictyoglomus turgidum TaxID=513050 RepID=A0A7C3SQM5_9BACT